TSDTLVNARAPLSDILGALLACTFAAAASAAVCVPGGPGGGTGFCGAWGCGLISPIGRDGASCADNTMLAAYNAAISRVGVVIISFVSPWLRRNGHAPLPHARSHPTRTSSSATGTGRTVPDARSAHTRPLRAP